MSTMVPTFSPSLLKLSGKFLDFLHTMCLMLFLMKRYSVQAFFLIVVMIRTNKGIEEGYFFVSVSQRVGSFSLELLANAWAINQVLFLAMILRHINIGYSSTDNAEIPMPFLTRKFFYDTPKVDDPPLTK